MLGTYSDFLAYADNCGLMFFLGKAPQGMPVLDKLTAPHQWHTGDAETDPWQWKDRAAAEKRLAFGNILGRSERARAPARWTARSSRCRESFISPSAATDGRSALTGRNMAGRPTFTALRTTGQPTGSVTRSCPPRKRESGFWPIAPISQPGTAKKRI